MSSDGYFDDDFDAEALEAIDAIEAAALAEPPRQHQAPPPPAPRPQPPARTRSLAADSSIDISFDFDERDLEAVDVAVQEVYSRPPAAPVAGPSTSSTRQFTRTNSNNLVQTTLFGGVVPTHPPSASRPPRSTQLERTRSGSRNLFGQQAKKVKKWDHTAFAETGRKTKKKGKKKLGEWFAIDCHIQSHMGRVVLRPWPPPMKLKPDLLEAKHWIYPTNRPKRDYQYNIAKHCLYENTLVALPTGLGKTFIAGVVMLNYYRWYPEGKIIFLAVTKPLVAQQIEACHDTCGIPGSDGVELTGEVASSLRVRYWEEKRVFYMTPQTLESDLKSGICDPSDVVLLVIATPGNKVETVQHVIDGLRISHIEIRNESSLDIKPYIFEKAVKTHIIRPTGEVAQIRDMLIKYIDLTGCISACYDYLDEIRKIDGVGDKKPIWKDDPDFKAIMAKLDEIAAQGGASHPKMEKLKDILINYFGSRMQDPDADNPENADRSCVIVFSSYRAVVEEIVKELDGHKPLIRAAAFVGQATDKKGRKGLTQKKQQAVQRFGRTGRKRSGEVHLLLAEAREEANMDTAKANYMEVQKVITNGDLYELYCDVPRLLPDNIRPECVEKVMEIQPYVREAPFTRPPKNTDGKRAPKRKRNDDPGRNIPPGMSADFQSANSIWKQFKKKKVEEEPDSIPEETRPFEELGQDGESDEEIEEGALGVLRRAQSEKVASTAKKKTKSSGSGLRRSKTDAPPKKKQAKGKGKAKEEGVIGKLSEISCSQLAKLGESDEDDMEIEGLATSSLAPARSLSSGSTSRASRYASPSPEKAMDVIDLSDTDEELFPEDKDPVLPRNGIIAALDAIAEEPTSPVEPEPEPTGSLPRPKSPPARNLDDMSWLVDDDDDLDIEIVPSSPPAASSRPLPQFERVEIGDDSIEVSEPVPSFPREVVSKPERQKVSFQEPPKPRATTSSAKSRLKPDMPPPALPARFTTAAQLSSPTTPEAPEPTFPVQIPKRRRIIASVASSDDEDDNEDLRPPPSSQRYLEPVESTPVRPSKRKKSSKPDGKGEKARREKPSLLAKNRNIVFDAEAVHSGDEESEGWSEDEEENEEDRAFIKNSPLTQVSPSYEQTQIYRRSLMTQDPNDTRGPMFMNGPIRGRPFGRMSPGRQWTPSSSPGPDGEGSEPNEYEFGSFVVPDNGDISYEMNSDDAVLDL
ncbi:DEAH family protein [Coprinopsis cinerea okayama7|uniref:ATP-dependent DNA helicase n=1 Tax=Coprinopsis cinerea (strain Okayama-7 / 130 / ATCC MYA-4618 / FGSC 9003) TaxID=240176 RepID=A8N0S1_COPC7|nr:DEAH family protein [Coprinopsis cinerea okayama7\|eukprot:XP_001828472.2 DEAH family protein [Coprinopsis cinerea okayama7\